MYNEELKEELIGAVLNKVYVNRVKFDGFTLYDVDTLILETDKGNYKFTVEGDCCSTGYIDHLGIDRWLTKGFGKIEGVKDITLDLSDQDIANSSQESDCIYGVRIKTEHGRIHIEHRNSSNGYYGNDYRIEKIESIEPNLYMEVTESF